MIYSFPKIDLLGKIWRLPQGITLETFKKLNQVNYKANTITIRCFVCSKMLHRQVKRFQTGTCKII